MTPTAAGLTDYAAMTLDDLRAEVARRLGWTTQTQPHGLVSWIDPQGRQWAQPPRLDVEAALALVPWKETKLELIFNGRIFSCSFIGASSYLSLIAYGATPAEAVARAWLAWMDAKE